MLNALALLKLLLNIKLTASIFTAGNDVTTAPGIPCVTAPDVLIPIPTSIPLKRLNLSGICVGGTPHAGLVVFWVKLMQRGYKRSIPGLYRFLKKQGIMAEKLPNPKYVPKPYEQMEYPGQRSRSM